MKYVIYLVISVSILFTIVKAQKDQIGDFPDGVHLKTVSQGWIPSEERRLSNVFTRFKLSNQTNKVIYYTVLRENELIPFVNWYKREIGKKEWERLTSSEKLPFLGETDLAIAPGMTLEFDWDEIGLRNQEQRLSIFVKSDKNAKEVEIFSNVYRPLTKK
jgi:hypothetical protein